MSLRIRLGNCDKTKTESSNNLLNVIYDKNNCLIEANKDLIQYNIGLNKNLFVFGKIIGIKLSDTKLIGVSSKLSEEIAKSFSDLDIENAIKKIEGRFIYIYVNGSYIKIGTDSLGQIDLYYQREKDGISLSSHLGLLPFIKDDDIVYDQVGVAHALYIYGYRPAKKHTLYKKVKRLGVHERVEWKNEKFSLVKEKNVLHNTSEFDFKEQHDTYANLFLDAIEKRSSTKGNIVYLSSGWDSTSILAALVHMYGAKKTRAVIGRMHFSKEAGICNPYEIIRAQKIADYFGVKLEIVEFDYYRRGAELTEKYSDFMKNQMVTSRED